MKKGDYIRKKQSVGRKTLSKKIGMANGLMIGIAFSLLLVVLEIMYGEIITAKEKQMMNTYLTNSTNIVDDKLKDMGRVSLACFSDEQVHEILGHYEEYSYLEQLSSEEYLHQFYTSLISIRDDIKGVYIFNKERLIFFQDSIVSSRKKNHPIDPYMEKLEIFSEEQGNVSGCHLEVDGPLEFMHYMQGHKDDKYFYLIRSIQSFSPYETIGYILLSAPEKTFRTILEKNLEDTMFFCLMSEEGQIVSSKGGEALEGMSEELVRVLREKKAEGKGEFWLKAGGENCLVSYLTSDYSGMTLITGKPAGKIYEEVIRSALYALGIFLLMGTATLLVTVRYTRKSLHPLEELSRTMSNFDTKNMEFRFAVTTQDETGKLMQSFNRMQDIISRLIEEEYKSKERLQEARIRQQRSSLLYLKNQVNPHFLYNTLDTIRIKAELNGDSEVAYMILQLVQFFRLNVKADRQLVTISHEVRLIQAYMNLMCYRYEHLKFECLVDKDLEDIRIPNFLLQPLVENGLMHGLRNRNYRGTIRLIVEKDTERKDYLYIRIYDNGVGMTPECREMVKSMLMTWQSDYWKKQEETHIGVLNVQMRLKMYYPDECGLTYRENPEGGVTAEILIKTEINEEWEENK